MKKRVAILQSNYIPWKGYFDLISSVDEFIIYDDTQFTRRDWRNRNLIKTPNGLRWLTIPVSVSGKYTQKICDTQVIDEKWGEGHWNLIRQNYCKAPFFSIYENKIRDLYLNSSSSYISDINLLFIRAICEILNIKTKISLSRDYSVGGVDKTDRLVSLCKLAGASEYLSGPSAAAYIDNNKFNIAGIVLRYADYSNYPIYEQSFGKFEHGVTILDLLFHTGLRAREYMKNL